MNNEKSDQTVIYVRCSKQQKSNIIKSLRKGEKLADFMLNTAEEEIKKRGTRKSV